MSGQTLTVKAVLNDWDASAHAAMLCTPATLAQTLQAIPFSEASAWCNITGNFGPDCTLLLDPGTIQARSPIRIKSIGDARAKNNITILALTSAASFDLSIGGSNNRIFIGRVGPFALNAVLWRNSMICIGDEASSNGARTILDHTALFVGRDSMFSDGILLQAANQHTIVDLKTMAAIAMDVPPTIIGEHVWLGRQASLMPGVTIGKGSIVAACAVVTKDIGECCLAAGVPANTIRQHVSWCRNADHIVNRQELDILGALPDGDVIFP